MEVLPASVNDAEAILRLQHTAYQSEAVLNGDCNIPPLTQTLDELKADFGSKTILKIIEGDQLLASGQARYGNGTCYISRMAVRPELQGQGIGSMLLSALENLFPQAARIELFTGASSLANLAMYSRRGYVEFKRAMLGKTTVVFLQRDLSERKPGEARTCMTS